MRQPGKRRQQHCFFWRTSGNMMSNSYRPSTSSYRSTLSYFHYNIDCIGSIGRSRDAFVTYFERIVLSIRRRVTFVWPPCRLRLSFRYKLLWKLTCSCCLRVWFGCHRVTFCRHRTCFGCWLAFDQVRGYLRPKFQIPYSCVHLVSTSGQCDASIMVTYHEACSSPACQQQRCRIVSMDTP